MSETRRKLTTIFSADVQDYTRLMGADEEGTLDMLKRYRDAMSGLIVSHGGRVINTWGDGLIAEFPSVVEAVRAAVDSQTELAGLNASCPTDARMQFRIGINLGDVIAEGDDIYGDGVNIAARLQASAAPGGIVISNTVYDQVRNKVPVGFDFLGALVVKNVSEGVPSYAVRIGEADQPAPKAPPREVHKPQPNPFDKGDMILMGTGRLVGLLAVIGVVLAVINLITWGGYFWAAWPILAFSVVAALRWVRIQTSFNRGIATLAVTGTAIALINLFTWSGTFWAIWPLMALTVAAAVRYVLSR